MAELGIPELLIILAILLVLFGPSRIAGIGKTLGTSIREFRNSMRNESQNQAVEALPTTEPSLVGAVSAGEALPREERS